MVIQSGFTLKPIYLSRISWVAPQYHITEASPKPPHVVFPVVVAWWAWRRSLGSPRWFRQKVFTHWVFICSPILEHVRGWMWRGLFGKELKLFIKQLILFYLIGIPPTDCETTSLLSHCPTLTWPPYVSFFLMRSKPFNWEHMTRNQNRNVNRHVYIFILDYMLASAHSGLCPPPFLVNLNIKYLKHTDNSESKMITMISSTCLYRMLLFYPSSRLFSFVKKQNVTEAVSAHPCLVSGILIIFKVNTWGTLMFTL